MRILLVAIGSLVLATGAHGQVSQPAPAVQGEVVDRDTGAGIRGATVLHLNGLGEQVEGVFTDENGAFRLRVPLSQDHRILVERLGYRPVEQGLGSPLRVLLSARAIELEGITASAQSRCEASPVSGDQTFALWEIARTGLRAAALTSAEELVQFRVATWVREVNQDGLIRESLSESVVDMTGVPFGAEDPEVLAADGYIRSDGNTPVAFGPDAEILLSDSFVDTHCFQIAGQNPRDPGQIGLTFEPVSGRVLPDIAGTLWVDIATGQLRSVDFEYVERGFPYATGSGGRIEFLVLEEGPWVGQNWRLRLQSGYNNGTLIFNEGGGTLLEVLSTRTG